MAVETPLINGNTVSAKPSTRQVLTKGRMQHQTGPGQGPRKLHEGGVGRHCTFRMNGSLAPKNRLSKPN
jgi:hypothetical protein